MRRVRDELEIKLGAQEKAVTEARRKAEELDNRLRESAADNATLKAELDQHGDELKRNEGGLLKELQEAKAAAAEAAAAYKKKAARSTKFESELTTLRKARTELDGKLKDEKKAASQFKRRAKENSRIAFPAARPNWSASRTSWAGFRTAKALQQSRPRGIILKSKPASVTASARLPARPPISKRNAASSNRPLCNRVSILDPARLGKAFVSSFRSQLRLPAANLMQAIRALLELPLSDKARELVETALEVALVVEATVLEDSGNIEPPREAA